MDPGVSYLDWKSQGMTLKMASAPDVETTVLLGIAITQMIFFGQGRFSFPIPDANLWIQERDIGAWAPSFFSIQGCGPLGWGTLKNRNLVISVNCMPFHREMTGWSLYESTKCPVFSDNQWWISFVSFGLSCGPWILAMYR